MKFAKELEENAVPEWRVKYLNYKQGKKRLKAVGRAVRSIDRSGQQSGQRNTPSLRDGPVAAFLRSRGWGGPSIAEEDNLGVPSGFASSVWERQDDLENAAEAIPIRSNGQVNERSPLRRQETNRDGSQPHMRRYGSIIGSPPGSTSPALERLSTTRTQASLLELPDPALDPTSIEGRSSEVDYRPTPPPTQMAHTGNAYVIRAATDVPTTFSPRSAFGSALRLHRSNSTPLGGNRPPLIKRVLSVAAQGTGSSREPARENDVALEAYRELDFRKAEFFNFLDGELEKIETFYKEKEDEAKVRLAELREQLHILREMRMHDIEVAERRKRGNYAPNGSARHSREEARAEADHADNDDDDEQSHLAVVEHLQRARQSIVSHMDGALDRVRTDHVGKTAKAMRDLGTPVFDAHQQDYTRRPQQPVNYRTGKRKLKLAFLEYYRSIELLKSYNLLNHTAFRKITKKCDKTMPGHKGAEYYKERVNKAYFVTSNALDVLLQSTEDYYARYFERGSHNAARAFFRQPGYKSLSFDGNMLRTGLFLGFGIAFAIYGLIGAIGDLSSSYDPIPTNASYLLQLYAGFFLCMFFTGMFCIACREWRRHKVNYAMIFEFHPRHTMDWRQLCELGALFMLYLGFIMSLNFQWAGHNVMYIYWPAMLLGISALTIFFPLPGLYHRSRMWFVASLSRLWLSGIYNVEFRDLFIGDLFCSMTYVFGNIELFFCLYYRSWDSPPQCNSSHSIILGVFTCIPATMRAAQVMRRYVQTKQAFPHIANFIKYCFNIGTYAMLATYRIQRGWNFLTAFAVVASINSVYCTTWDLAIDWSLGNRKGKILCS